MKTENTTATPLIALALVLMTVSLFGQCEPYNHGPYTKQDVYIAPIVPLIGTFLAVEYAQNNGASSAQRDRVAGTGFAVMIATCSIDYYIKNQIKRKANKHINRRQIRRRYGL